MNKRSLLTTTLISLILVISPSMSSAENQPSDDQTWPPIAQGQYGFTTYDQLEFDKSYSHFFVWDGNQENNCSSLDDLNCKNLIKQNGNSWGAIYFLPPCNEATPGSDCIENLNLAFQGKSEPAKFLGNIVSETFNADKEKGIPLGGKKSLWSNPFSSDPNDALLVSASGYTNNVQDKSAAGDWRLRNFSASIAPYSINLGQSSDCIQFSEKTCLKKSRFESEMRISLTLRLNKELTGWIGGRLGDPLVSTSILNSSQNLLTIDAKPINVGFVSARTNFAEATSKMKELSKNFQGESWSSFRIDVLEKMFDAYKNFLSDKITSIQPTWFVTDGYGQSTQNCLNNTNKFIGLVSTNAPAFQFEAPTFDGTALTYKLAGLHLQPNGKPFEGSYDLILRSESARCLYGFSSAPIQATISILGSEGEQNISTSVLSEKNGWLHLSVNGFNFSNPAIRVQFTQPSSQSSKSQVKVPTITCLNGSKKLRISKPQLKCPKGFRRIS